MIKAFLNWFNKGSSNAETQAAPEEQAIAEQWQRQYLEERERSNKNQQVLQEAGDRLLQHSTESIFPIESVSAASGIYYGDKTTISFYGTRENLAAYFGNLATMVESRKLMDDQLSKQLWEARAEIERLQDLIARGQP